MGSHRARYPGRHTHSYTGGCRSTINHHHVRELNTMSNTVTVFAAAGGIFDTITSLTTAARTAILALSVVAWLGLTLLTAVSRKSILAGAGVFFAGAFMVWGMFNSDLLRDKAGKDLTGRRVIDAVVVDR